MCNHMQMLLRLDGQTPVAQRSATVGIVHDQFRMAWDLHNTNIKFLHPSKGKRRRLRTRPQALAALKVSSVVKDIRAVQKKVKRLRFAMFIIYAHTYYKRGRRT